MLALFGSSRRISATGLIPARRGVPENSTVARFIAGDRQIRDFLGHNRAATKCRELVPECFRSVVKGAHGPPARSRGARSNREAFLARALGDGGGEGDDGRVLAGLFRLPNPAGCGVAVDASCAP